MLALCFTGQTPLGMVEILAMIIWGLLTSAFITRLIRFPHSALAEVRHPVPSSFVSLLGNDDAGGDWLCSVVSLHWRCACSVFGVVVQLMAPFRQPGLWARSTPEEATTPSTVSADKVAANNLYRSADVLWCVGLQLSRPKSF